MIDIDRLNELSAVYRREWSYDMVWSSTLPVCGSIRLFLDLNPTVCIYHEVISEGFAFRGKHELD